MGIADLSKEEFSKVTRLKTEIDQELVEFAYENLNNLPYDGERNENYERMISGMTFNRSDPLLTKGRLRVRDIVADYGNIRARDFDTVEQYEKAKLDCVKSFIGRCGNHCLMEYPFSFDYGFNTYIEDGFFANFGLKILDLGIVKIGKRVLCGTNVSILTASHPVDPTLRTNNVACGLTVTIKDFVWLCANCTILPGVTIGEYSVIAAGSIVNKDIPPFSLVAGIPGKVIKTLDPIERELDIDELLKKHGLDCTRFVEQNL